MSFFAHTTWKDTENAIYEALLRRSQLTAALTANDVLLGQTPEQSAAKRESFLFSPQGGALGSNFMNLDTSSVRESFVDPGSESFVTKCLNKSGVELYCGFAPIEKSSFYAIEALPRSSRIQILIAQMRKLIPTFLGLLALAGFAALLVTFYLLGPLRAITAATRAFSRGHTDLTALPLNRSDEIGQLARSFKDMVTELKNREKNLTKAGLKLAHQARLASIGQMGASVAHEVKNPLTSMMGYASYLASKISDPQLKEAAEIIQKESERCGQILTQMLRFSRNDSNDFKVFAINEVIESAKLLIMAELKSARMSLKVDYLSHPIVRGNPQQIQQVILNILMNAIQACRPLIDVKPQASELLLSVTEEGSRVNIKLIDSGPGMTSDIQMRLFEPFFTTKERGAGTGLGLSVALEILQTHGGDLRFESQEGVGSAFWIELPLHSDSSETSSQQRGAHL